MTLFLTILKESKNSTLSVCLESEKMFFQAMMASWKSSSALPKGKMLSESTKLACPLCNLPVLLSIGRNSNTFPTDQICNFSQKISWVLYMHIHKMKITWFVGTLGLEAEGFEREIFQRIKKIKARPMKVKDKVRTQVKLLQRAGTYRC